MKKVFILLVFCSTLTLSLLLKWQWHAYSSESSKSAVSSANQKIQIVSSSNNININQTFSGLNPKKEYKIMVPNLISDWTCETKSGESCKSNDQNPTTFQPEDGVIKIVYSIPINRDDLFTILSNWKMKLYGVSIQHSSIAIAESYHRKGTWIAGLPFKAYKELDLIDFFSFEGDGDFETLYFQKKPFIFHYQEIFYGYYSNGQENKKLNLSKYSQLKKKNFTVIVSSDFLTYENKDMLIVKNTQPITDIDHSLVTQFFKYKLENETDWLVSLFTSFSFNNKSPIKKTNEILNELNRELSSSELQEFYQKVAGSPSTLGVKELDQILGEVKGLKTSFFQKNIEANSNVPLYFMETKLVNFKEEKEKKAELIYMDSKRLYPIETMLSIIGYKISQVDDKLNLNKKSFYYQFDLNHNLFLFNGHDYGLLESPIVEVNHHYYMDQNWLQTLFKISIKEDGAKLTIIEDRK
ncbi:MAG TPA: hypothetical protein VEV44_16360 [Pseudoneobacillus sp.]|nr:hypothetical protein [Pseudoneobacillus sp.]